MNSINRKIYVLTGERPQKQMDGARTEKNAQRDVLSIKITWPENKMTYMVEDVEWMCVVRAAVDRIIASFHRS